MLLFLCISKEVRLWNKNLSQFKLKIKIDFILANRNIPKVLEEFIASYIKLENILDSIIDNVIISNNIDYKKMRKDFIKISKLLKEMESMSNELNIRKIKRNSDIKS